MPIFPPLLELGDGLTAKRPRTGLWGLFKSPRPRQIAWNLRLGRQKHAIHRGGMLVTLDKQIVALTEPELLLWATYTPAAPAQLSCLPSNGAVAIPASPVPGDSRREILTQNVSSARNLVPREIAHKCGKISLSGFGCYDYGFVSFVRGALASTMLFLLFQSIGVKALANLFSNILRLLRLVPVAESASCQGITTPDSKRSGVWL